MSHGPGIPPAIEVLAPGMLTTVQDWPGRVGLWRVGVPPSGPMDDLSFRLGNWALGNEEGAAGLECTLLGPRLRFGAPTTVMVTGAEAIPTVDGEPVACWEPLALAAGAELDVGKVTGPGLRAYVLVAGGIDVPLHLGSASTFTLGGFGGHEGWALNRGDQLTIGSPRGANGSPTPVASDQRPQLTDAWQLAVAEGPHGDGEWLTPADIADLYESRWEVHFNSAARGCGWSARSRAGRGLRPDPAHGLRRRARGLGGVRRVRPRRGPRMTGGAPSHAPARGPAHSCRPLGDKSAGGCG